MANILAGGDSTRSNAMSDGEFMRDAYAQDAGWLN